MVGEAVDRGDARVDQACALAGPHARNQKQVIMLANLNRALRTAETRPNAFVFPTHRRTCCDVLVEQALQRHPSKSVYRQKLVYAIARVRAVAEDELGRR